MRLKEFESLLDEVIRRRIRLSTVNIFERQAENFAEEAIRDLMKDEEIRNELKEKMLSAFRSSIDTLKRKAPVRSRRKTK